MMHNFSNILVYRDGFNLKIGIWISNHIPYFLWVVITHPFLIHIANVTSLDGLATCTGRPLTNVVTETERSSGWQPWYSLETLKLVFNVSSEYQGCHPDYLFVSVVPIHCCALSLQWRHNEYDCVSNHQRLHGLLIRLFRCRSKETSKRGVTRLCEGNSPETDEFPAQRVSNAENVSIWWRHHYVDHIHLKKTYPFLKMNRNYLYDYVHRTMKSILHQTKLIIIFAWSTQPLGELPPPPPPPPSALF